MTKCSRIVIGSLLLLPVTALALFLLGLIAYGAWPWSAVAVVVIAMTVKGASMLEQE